MSGATVKVWIAQCLCPQRHAIVATAGEAKDQAAAEIFLFQPLRTEVRRMLTSGKFNPWCGLCGSPSETWTYEIGPTPFTSMKEALPALKESEREQAIIRQAFGR